MPLPQSPLRFRLPITNEPRWSDELAVLCGLDPEPMLTAIGIPQSEWPAQLSVVREQTSDDRSRVDLVLIDDDGGFAILEVKLLASIGTKQLERYSQKWPTARHRIFVSPEAVAYTVNAVGWRAVTLDSILDAYSAGGRDDLCGLTAAAAGAWLKQALPSTRPDTVWQAADDSHDPKTRHRAYLAWLWRSITAPAHSPTLPWLVNGSSSGGAGLLSLTLPLAGGYSIGLECEDAARVKNLLRKPRIQVLLAVNNVETSADYDHDLLAAVMKQLLATVVDWDSHDNGRATSESTRLKSWEIRGRAELRQVLGDATPIYGFGEAQASNHGWCGFGPRLTYAGTTTLSELADGLTTIGNELREISENFNAQATVGVPETS